MKNVTKKIIIYSMVGIMQVGLGTAIVAASPLHNDGSQRIVQLDNHGDRQFGNARQHQHDERLRAEHERHQRELRRHHHESDRDYYERRDRENRRHDRELHNIEAFLFGILIGSQIN